MEHTFTIPALFNHEIVAVTVRPYTRKRRNRVAERNFFTHFVRLYDYLIKSVASSRSIAVGYFFRGRSEQYISVYGRRNEYAFTFFRGSEEKRMLYETAVFFIKQNIFAASAVYRQIVARQSGDFSALKPRAVDYDFRLNFVALSGVDFIAVFFVVFINFYDFEISYEFRAVIHSVAYGGYREFVRTDYAAPFGVKSAFGVIRNVGFCFFEFFGGNDFKAIDAVLFAAFFKRFESLQIFVRKRNDERAVVFIFNAEFAGNRRHHSRAFHVEFCFKRSLFRVETRMHYSAIGFALPHTDVAFFFEHYGVDFISCEIAKYERAYHSSADYGYVENCHIKYRSPYK